MKKTKLLLPIAGLAALGGVVPAIVTSCAKTTDQTNIFEIDSENVLHGFKSGLTVEDIEQACNGTLTIPAKVVRIAPYAFCNKGTLVSTIPTSIKKLVFATDAKGKNYLQGSKLDGYLNEEAIGAYSFANSPIENVDFPLGLYLNFDKTLYDKGIDKGIAYTYHKYDIGEGAFMGSNLKMLKMPHPGYYLTQPEEIPVETNDVRGWIRLSYRDGDNKLVTGKEFFEIVNKWEIFKNAGMKNIGKYAFLNCNNLTSVIFSPWQNTTTNTIDFKAFGTYNPLTGEFGASKINYVDMSTLTWRKACKGHAVQDIKDIKAKVLEQINSGTWEFGTNQFFGLNLDWNITKGVFKTPTFAGLCFATGDEATGWEYVGKYLNSFVNDDFYQKGGSIDDAKTIATIKSQNGDVVYFGYKYSGGSSAETNWALPRELGHLDFLDQKKMRDTYFENIYDFKDEGANDEEINVDLNNLSSDLHTFKNDLKGKEEEKYGYMILPDDMKFKVTESTWSEGAKKVGISFKQLKSTEIPESKRSNFVNQYYKVVLNGTPTDDSYVELKVLLTSEKHNIQGLEVPLKITFTRS